LPRILSIDYGLKRCGIAVTDPLQIIVNGLTTVGQPELIDFVKNYCLGNQVEKIILGNPVQSDGSDTEMSLEIKKLEKTLTCTFPQIIVELYNERKSSQDAVKVLVRSGARKKKRSDKELIDKMSAVIILQRYLGHI
jgi:putative Holliday junction resolvase